MNESSGAPVSTSHPEVLAREAIDSFHQGNVQKALDQALLLIHITDFEAEMSHLVGACFHQLTSYEEALPFLRRAIISNPLESAYLNTYGVVLRKAALFEQSSRSYEKAIALDPKFSDAFYNRGNVLVELKRKDQAADNFRRCLELNPTHNNAHHNLANIYRDRKKIDLALEHYQRSDECQHFNPDMHCNWGLALQLKEHWSRAIDRFEVAINQKSDHAPSYVNLGGALAVQERFTEACASFRRGVELDSNCLDAKFNLGLTLLTIGQLEEGWKFYETRLSLPKKVITPFPDIPVWDGCLDLDSPLLVWAEQGYGDNIQFVRYIPILIEMGINVVLSTRKPLISLFQKCLMPSAPPIIEHRRQDLQGFSHHIPLLSLPRVLNTSMSTIPRMPGYLKPPVDIPDKLRLKRQPFALNIGLVWASGADNKDMYEDKSMKLDSLMPMFDNWRNERLLVIHSLQVGVDSEDVNPWLNQWGVVDWSHSLESFYDTAVVVKQLDLVISVDTAVAHIAGAMDVPVWLMLQHNADFRWLRGRDDSPWYNSMTLFRQKALGDWDSVVLKISNRLKQLLG
tara:strand:- start:337 stop:2043 length:1707 start_codon:yes stop_codon:yes gene_type:complete